MNKKVPLVIYKNGLRTAVGEMEVDSETFKGIGVITSESLARSLGLIDNLDHVSIESEPPIVTG